ncbi:MAG: extensin family protein [Pseudomonadota bacterium]
MRRIGWKISAASTGLTLAAALGTLWAATPSAVYAPEPTARDRAYSIASSAATSEPDLISTPRSRPGEAASAQEPGPAAVSSVKRAEFDVAELDIDPAAEMLCGDQRLRGRRLAAFDEGGGCALTAPVAVAEIAGVTISPVAVTECPLALVAANWIEGELTPLAEKALGAPVAKITHVSAYVCKTRNSVPGARLSFHATGEALDIAAVTLDDGRRTSVSEDWDAAEAFWPDVWRTACGPFGTVLGPEADAQHADHLHLDIAKRRSPYCR